MRIKVHDTLLVVLFAGMLALNVLQVAYRYVLNSPLHWSEEAAIYMMVWMVFFAVAVLTRDREHIVIDLLGSVRQGRGLRLLDTLQFILTGAILGVFAWLSTEYLLSVIDRGANSTALRLPMWIPVVSMPLGATLGALYAFRNAWTAASDPNEDAIR